jgi:hypothetical protein
MPRSNTRSCGQQILKDLTHNRPTRYGFRRRIRCDIDGSLPDVRTCYLSRRRRAIGFVCGSFQCCAPQQFVTVALNHLAELVHPWLGETFRCEPIGVDRGKVRHARIVLGALLPATLLLLLAGALYLHCGRISNLNNQQSYPASRDLCTPLPSAFPACYPVQNSAR